MLAQIPVAFTEETLWKQTYTGIINNNSNCDEGEEMPPEMQLSGFCNENDVLVAVPSSMSAKECARLANQILRSEKVIQMVSTPKKRQKSFQCYETFTSHFLNNIILIFVFPLVYCSSSKVVPIRSL